MNSSHKPSPVSPAHSFNTAPTPLSRRAFLGSTAGWVGAASVGYALADALSVQAADEAEKAVPAKDIRIGMMTAPVSHLPLEQALDMAKRCHMAALEVMAGSGSHLLDPMNFTEADAAAVKEKLAERGLEISSLANYMNSTEPGKTEEVQNTAKKMIDAAALLNVPTICMITGLPHPGMSKIQMLRQVVPQVFRPILDHAKEKGVRVAVENWFATNLQGLDTFDCLMETIPDEHFGFNYDPSHLVHQELDIKIPVKRFSKRIFHTHAKDCLVDVQRRNYVGILAQGWWRYAIPGYGDIQWGEYIGTLRQAGYRGVLSIEHEDDTFGPEEGFRHGARYLSQFC
jgi:sugar phosphate isomerase/epimerase